MSRRRALSALLMAILAVWPLRAGEPTLPIKDITPGMEGIGRTVFEGSRVEDFKVHILGVLQNIIGPSRSLILARLEGGPLATTGVIAGMSGSPVYVDGRLIGAVSYSLGQFSREAIAGITPIDEMVDATSSTARRPSTAQVRLELPVTSASLTATLQRVFDRTSPFARSTNDVSFSGRSASSWSGAELGAMLQPIATPLVLSGFSGDTATVDLNRADPDADDRARRWTGKLRRLKDIEPDFRGEGFYERFPAKGQVERVARVHRRIDQLLGIQPLGVAREED